MGSRGRLELVRRQLAEAGLDRHGWRGSMPPSALPSGQKRRRRSRCPLAQIVEIKSHRQLTEGFTPEIRAAWAQCRQEQTDAVLATIVSRHGSMPREVGTKMLILPDGSTAGSVGGGIMEYRARQLAEKMLAGTEVPQQLASFTTGLEDDEKALAACGGSMELFLQVLAGGTEVK